MSDQPLVSIIATFYNSGDFVHSAMDSMLKQTYQNIEFICVNDGSKDDTLIHLQEYQKKESRIIIVDKENEGSAHNGLAAGQKIVKGKYVLTFDHDDGLSEDAIQKAVESMETNPNWGISLFRVKLVDEKGVFKETRLQPKNTLNGSEAIEATIGKFKYAFRCLYRKEIFLSFLYKADDCTWINYDEYVGRRLLYNAQIIGTNEGVYFYVNNPNSVTSGIGHRKLTSLEVDLLNKNFIKEIDLYPKIDIQFERYFFNKLNVFMRLYYKTILKKESLNNRQKEYYKGLFKRCYGAINKQLLIDKVSGFRAIYLKLIFSSFTIYSLIRRMK